MFVIDQIVITEDSYLANHQIDKLHLKKRNYKKPTYYLFFVFVFDPIADNFPK